MIYLQPSKLSPYVWNSIALSQWPNVVFAAGVTTDGTLCEAARFSVASGKHMGSPLFSQRKALQECITEALKWPKRRAELDQWHDAQSASIDMPEAAGVSLEEATRAAEDVTIASAITILQRRLEEARGKL